MIRKLMLVLTILALTATQALARGGGGFHGGGFHGSGSFHGGFRGAEFHGGRFGRFDRFGVFGFYGPSFYYPYPYYADAYPYPVYSPPALVEQPPVVYQQSPGQREVLYPNGKYMLYGDGILTRRTSGSGYRLPRRCRRPPRRSSVLAERYSMRSGSVAAYTVKTSRGVWSAPTTWASKRGDEP